MFYHTIKEQIGIARNIIFLTTEGNDIENEVNIKIAEDSLEAILAIIESLIIISGDSTPIHFEKFEIKKFINFLKIDKQHYYQKNIRVNCKPTNKLVSINSSKLILKLIITIVLNVRINRIIRIKKKIDITEEITITINEDAKSVVILISDTEDIHDRLKTFFKRPFYDLNFQKHFTPPNFEFQLCRELINIIDANLELVNSDKNYKTIFKLSIPKNILNI